jgi:hypothetical protein
LSRRLNVENASGFSFALAFFLVSFALPLIALRLLRPAAVIAPASPVCRGRVSEKIVI